MTISIIIPCRNEAGHIRGFLDSLLEQEIESGWHIEVLVADGMSDDGTREILQEYARRAPNVHLIDNPGKIVSTGLNAAIKAACGEIVIRMDAHTVYAKDYVQQCIHALWESGADNVGGPWVAKGRGAMGRAIAAAFRLPFCTGGGKSHDPNYEGEVDTVYLGCWPRTVFQWAGLFDPDLVRNQDDEFNFRLRRLGGKIWQSPRIKSSYSPRGSLAALFRQYAQYGFWRVAVVRKHRALASWRHAVPALFVAWLAILLAIGTVLTVSGMVSAGIYLYSLLSGTILIHLLAGLAASLSFAKTMDAPVLLRMPIVIAIYHVGYGLGFLLGVMRSGSGGSGAKAPDRFFTALTR